MKLDLFQRQIAIIGGNDPCCEIVSKLTGTQLSSLGANVLMVADPLVRTGASPVPEKKGFRLQHVTLTFLNWRAWTWY